MKKVISLRDHLLASIPELKNDPDRLLMFTNQGNLVCLATNGLSFEQHYTLEIILTDYSGGLELIGAVLFAWIRENQSELMTNHQKAKDSIRFETDVLSNNNIDLSIQIPLSERIIVKKTADGTHSIESVGEPQYSSYLPETNFKIIDKDGNILANWTTATPADDEIVLDMPFPQRKM